MKHLILSLIFLFSYSSLIAQEQWLDVNYAGDGEEYHNMDIYLPDDGEPTHKAVIIIYGSAWFANNMKGMAYGSMGKPLLENGFAVRHHCGRGFIVCLHCAAPLRAWTHRVVSY